MRILAVDTATTSCSVAIVDTDAVLAEVTTGIQQTHAKHLMGMIDTVIDRSATPFSDLDGFAVTRGPGSFTGLRIGIATVKGLATASGKPLVGVSTLDALAMQGASSSHLICSLLDARRGEVYSSRYRYVNGCLEMERDEAVSTAEKAISDVNETCLFLGNGAVLYRKIIEESLGERAQFAPSFHDTIRASTVAHLSMTAFETGHTDNVGEFVPVYIRKSDAEIHRAFLNPSP
ncbi:MAG: tRNA (adenosine(37)-N6)-threonylcarbamoyltransferase complex dimerization subunit type 1 TsaB [Desulfobacterales bacterium]